MSENSVPLNPMVLLIIIPFLNGYFIGNINPTFSDKPTGYLVANFARLCGGPQRLVPEGRADRGQIRALGPCWGEGGLEFGESWPLSIYIYMYIYIYVYIYICIYI